MVNLKLRYAFEMRILTVEPKIHGSTVTLKVRIFDAYLKCRAGYFQIFRHR